MGPQFVCGLVRDAGDMKKVLEMVHSQEVPNLVRKIIRFAFRKQWKHRYDSINGTKWMQYILNHEYKVVEVMKLKALKNV